MTEDPAPRATDQAAEPASGLIVVGGTAGRIEAAALDLFFERGFRSTSMRDIAQACGITAAALYNHFASKDRILYSMVQRLHVELDSVLVAADRGAGDDPRERLAALARAHAIIHTRHRKDARVANSEIFSLEEPGRSEIIAFRRHGRDMFQAAIEDGARTGVFEVPDVPVLTFAILNMGIRIADWFQPGGRLTEEEVAGIHAELALRMAGVTEPARRTSGGRRRR